MQWDQYYFLVGYVCYSLLTKNKFCRLRDLPDWRFVENDQISGAGVYAMNTTLPSGTVVEMFKVNVSYRLIQSFVSSSDAKKKLQLRLFFLFSQIITSYSEFTFFFSDISQYLKFYIPDHIGLSPGVVLPEFLDPHRRSYRVVTDCQRISNP